MFVWYDIISTPLLYENDSASIWMEAKQLVGSRLSKQMTDRQTRVRAGLGKESQGAAHKAVIRVNH